MVESGEWWCKREEVWQQIPDFTTEQMVGESRMLLQDMILISQRGKFYVHGRVQSFD